MKKVFITGGAGFIGAHLVNKLAEDHRVVVYDHFKKNTLANLGYDANENVETIKGDILDEALLQESMKGADIVIHAAAIVGVGEVNDQLMTMKTNVFGTYNVLESARLCGIKDRVIVFSTSEIFGEMAYKVTETDNLQSGPPGESRWCYGISKVAGEHFANAYFKTYGLPIVNVRPFNIYGPGQTMDGAMKMFIWKALRNEDITINGEGNPIRAWCYIDDFVDGIMRCIENPKAIGESFNIGNPRTAITVYRLAKLICTLTGSGSKIVHGDPLPMEIHLRVPCVDKARELLGYEPQIDLEQGIMRTVSSVKNEMKMPQPQQAATVNQA